MYNTTLICTIHSENGKCNLYLPQVSLTCANNKSQFPTDK